MADSSETGWETINQCVSSPQADDSEDESRLRRAESRAVRKKNFVLSIKNTNRRLNPKTRLQ